MARLRWDDVAEFAGKRGYILCRDDVGFSVVLSATSEELKEANGTPRYWPTLKAVKAWLETQSSSPSTLGKTAALSDASEATIGRYLGARRRA
jgi:hypothetical protein